MDKNICVFTTVHDFNDNRVFYKEVLSLVALGFNLTYVAPNIDEKFIKKYDQIKFISIRKEKSLLKRVMSSNKITKLLLSLKCDSYHFHDVECIKIGLKLKKKKCKVIYDVHEDYRNQMLNKFYLKKWIRKVLSKYIARLEKKADKIFDGVIVADNFIKNYFNNGNCEIVFNYPSLQNYSSCNIATNIKKYDLIFPGSMGKPTARNIISIVKECNIIGCYPKVLIISPYNFEGGKKWLNEEILSSGCNIEDFTLMDKVTPLEVPYYISITKIGLLPLKDTPKLRKNIPTKLFEYMYCGVPVISTDLPPTRQYLEKIECGFLYNEMNFNLMAVKIKELLTDDNLCSILGSNGRKAVFDLYNWENETIKIMKIYNNII